MQYYVSLGDIEFDKVITAAQTNNRDIAVYDSVGGGKFPVPQNKGLKEWTIKCEIDDYDIIKQLDKMQKKDTPVRLVINCGDYKVSERVLLKSHNETQEYAGVWPTTLTVLQHVNAGVKTADVPYVARAGEPPPLPKAQVLGDGTGGTKTAYDLLVTAQRTAESPYGPLEGGFKRKVFDSEEKRNAYLASVQFIDAETGKEVNPAAADGKAVNVSYEDLIDPKGELSTGVFGGTATDNIVTKSVSAAWSAIADGFKRFDESIGVAR